MSPRVVTLAIVLVMALFMAGTMGPVPLLAAALCLSACTTLIFAPPKPPANKMTIGLAALACFLLGIFGEAAGANKLDGFLNVRWIQDPADAISTWLQTLFPQSHQLAFDTQFFNPAFFAGLVLNIGLICAAAVLWRSYATLVRLKHWWVGIKGIVFAPKSERAALDRWWPLARRVAAFNAKFVPLPPDSFLLGRYNIGLHAGNLGVLAMAAWLQVFGLPWIGTLPDCSVCSRHTGPWRNEFLWFVWASPLVFAAMLLGASRRNVLTSETPPARADPSRADARSDIAGLLTDLQDKYRDLVLIERSLGDAAKADGQAVPRDASGDPLVVSILDRLGRHAEAGLLANSVAGDITKAFTGFWGDIAELSALKSIARRDILFKEDLVFDHILVLAELIQSCGDRGGKTLVVTPAPSLRRIVKAFKTAGRSAVLTQRTCVIGADIFDPAQPYDVIFVSEDDLGPKILARGHDSALRRIFDALRLIVVLDFHRLEVAHLRLRLRRLRTYVDQDALRIVCQTGMRDRIEQGVANAFTPLGGSFIDVALMAGREIGRNIVVWRNDEASLKALRASELKDAAQGRELGIAALLLIPMLRFNVGPTYAEGMDTWVGNLVFNLGNALMNTEQNRRIGAKIVNFLEGMDDLTMRNRRSLIVEDRGNLPEAIRHQASYAGSRPYVVMVVAHDYALRDWYMDLLAKGGSQSLNDTRLLPIAPDSTGGLTELAVALATEFDRNDTIFQTDVDRLFEDIDTTGAASAFAIYPTPAGINRLFERERGRSAVIASAVNVYHEVTLTSQAVNRTELIPRFSLPAKQAGQGDDSDRFYLPAGDYGLTYDSGTIVFAGGQVWKVDRVEPARILIKNEQPPPARPVYRFSRHYALSFEPGQVTLERAMGPTDIGTDLSFTAVLLRGAFRRRTVARSDTSELSKPRGPDRRGWTESHVSAEPKHASLLLLRYELRGALAQDDPILSACRAFTLAATLQDVLASLFPPLAHRLAVVSPQAEACILAMLAEGDADDRFPVDLYPRLVASFDDTKPYAGRNGRPASGSEVERAITAFLDRYRRLPRPAAAAPNQKAEARAFIDLIVIEDAWHDLGAVRAISDQDVWMNVLSVWRSFVGWLAMQRDGGRLFYSFGDKALSPVFAFEAARDFLEALPRTDGVGLP